MNTDANNPYASPAIPADDGKPALPALSDDEIRRKLAIPAYGMAAAGVAVILALFMTVPMVLLDYRGEPPNTGFGALPMRIVLAIVQLVLLGGLSFVFLRGFLAMRQLRGYSAALWAAVIGIGTMGGACGLGLPFAIWAFALLCDERIRGGFGQEPIRWLPRRSSVRRAAPPA